MKIIQLFQGDIPERESYLNKGREATRAQMGEEVHFWLEHRVHEGMSCKVNCKGRVRLNTRGPP